MARMITGTTPKTFHVPDGFAMGQYIADSLFEYRHDRMTSSVVRLYNNDANDIVFRGTGFAGDLDTGLTGGTVTSIVLRVGISTDKLPLPYYLPRSR